MKLCRYDEDKLGLVIGDMVHDVTAAQTEIRNSARYDMMGDCVVAEIKRAAAVREPAHDGLVARQHLLAIDAEVLARFARAACDHQPPGDERRGVAGPAGLDGQHVEIDLITTQHHFLALGARHFFRRQIERLFEQRGFVDEVAETFRWFGFFQKGEQFADVTQRGHILLAHGESDTLRRAEQVAQHRYRIAFGILEQQRRTFCAQRAIADLGHFQFWIDRNLDAFQFADAFEMGQELPQIAEHGFADPQAMLQAISASSS